MSTHAPSPGGKEAVFAQKTEPVNLLITLNAAYIPPLKVMLSSLFRTNPGKQIDLYLLHSSLTEEDLAYIGSFAAAAASLSTEVSGGIPSIPEKDAVLKAM